MGRFQVQDTASWQVRRPPSWEEREPCRRYTDGGALFIYRTTYFDAFLRRKLRYSFTILFSIAHYVPRFLLELHSKYVVLTLE